MDDLLVNIASQLKNHLINLHKEGYRYICVAGDKKELLQVDSIQIAKTDGNQKDNQQRRSKAVVNEKPASIDFMGGNDICSLCPLSASKQKDMVFGYGSLNSKLMFITETPEKVNNSKTVFLSGKSELLFANILRFIGFELNNVYLTYILKCVTPSNRNFVSGEIDTCKKILYRQIDTIKPKVICSLGSVATSALLGTVDSISKLRGKPIEYRNSLVIPTFHPSYLLRSAQMKKYVCKDMLLIKKMLFD